MTKISVYRAFDFTEEGEKWIRITDDRSGDVWDEPITGWSLVLDLVRGKSYYEHRNGRIAVRDEF